MRTRNDCKIRTEGVEGVLRVNKKVRKGCKDGHKKERRICRDGAKRVGGIGMGEVIGQYGQAVRPGFFVVARSPPRSCLPVCLSSVSINPSPSIRFFCRFLSFIVKGPPYIPPHSPQTLLFQLLYSTAKLRLFTGNSPRGAPDPGCIRYLYIEIAWVQLNRHVHGTRPHSVPRPNKRHLFILSAHRRCQWMLSTL